MADPKVETAQYQPCSAECHGCPVCDPGLASPPWGEPEAEFSSSVRRIAAVIAEHLDGPCDDARCHILGKRNVGPFSEHLAEQIAAEIEDTHESWQCRPADPKVEKAGAPGVCQCGHTWGRHEDAILAPECLNFDCDCLRYSPASSTPEEGSHG